MARKWRIKKGDEVIVLAGKDKGVKGDVLKVLRGKDRVIVQGVGMIKRHTRPSSAGPGGIVEKEASIHVSNVACLDPESGQATRVGYRTLEGGRKVRFAKHSGEIIDV